MKKELSLESKSYTRLHKHSLRFSPYPVFQKIGLTHITPDSVSKFGIQYGLPSLLALFAYVGTYFFNQYVDPSPFYLILFLATVVSACIGGLTSGVYATGLSGVLAFTLYSSAYKSSSQPYLLIVPFSIFVIGALIISIVIDRVKNARTIQKLQTREKAYAQTLTTLQQKYEQANKAIKARDEFLSIASHELKSPLTSMLLNLDNMVDSIRNVSLANFSVPKLMKVLTNAEAQIRWLSTMINDLLNVSLIDTGRMDLRREEVDLSKLAKQVSENFSEQLKKERYRVSYRMQDKVIGKWDRTRIEQAITNLFSNAIKYGDGNPITVRVYNSGGVGKFSIQDRGIGVDRKERKSIFKRFKRATQSGDYKKGLGVGLYITNQIVEAHGGRIKVASNPLRGSTFTIELPLHKDRLPKLQSK